MQGAGDRSSICLGTRHGERIAPIFIGRGAPFTPEHAAITAVRQKRDAALRRPLCRKDMRNGAALKRLVAGLVACG
jgi:hypothetical protein